MAWSVSAGPYIARPPQACGRARALLVETSPDEVYSGSMSVKHLAGWWLDTVVAALVPEQACILLR